MSEIDKCGYGAVFTKHLLKYFHILAHFELVYLSDWLYFSQFFFFTRIITDAIINVKNFKIQLNMEQSSKESLSL